ncbi:MAG: 30S ribosomal protein S9 [Candidatus Moraniibacteriota bacterium]|nr:MAG: 30S ribosomal protein S9 [Candidatus Moranbacteria bacterium]
MVTKKDSVKKTARESKNLALHEKSSVSDPVIAVSTDKYFSGVGRRKTAVATVRIFEDASDSESDVSVNGKSVKVYFPTARLQSLLLDPIRAVGLENKFRISVHVRGGGLSGQASASGLGLARALVVANVDHRPLLKAGSFLTRDARKVERKKPGLNKARRAPQWSKR